MGTFITNARSIARDGRAIRVDAPDQTIWFFLYPDDSQFTVLQDGADHQVSRSMVERVANHDDNEYETVPVLKSPFADDAPGGHDCAPGEVA